MGVRQVKSRGRRRAREAGSCWLSGDGRRGDSEEEEGRMMAAAERSPRVWSLGLDVCLSLLLCHFPIKLLQ